MTTRPTRESHFTTTLLVPQPPEAVFAAVTNVRGWWSSSLEGPSDQLGQAFTYRHGTLHRSTQTVTELVPGKRVVWRVSDAELTFARDRAEWNGTELVFEIAQKGGQTELRFSHVGLVPALECYTNCSKGWGFYIGESLQP